MNSKQPITSPTTSSPVTSFDVAKFALQVLESDINRCDNKFIIDTAAKVERFAQKALCDKEIDQAIYKFRIKDVLDALSERFQKNCNCKSVR